ncbi:hypothetical protein NL676_004686 [Syzygium grande]|nr:hypothetical protein NL676_004686 [Syzygium grande]
MLCRLTSPHYSAQESPRAHLIVASLLRHHCSVCKATPYHCTSLSHPQQRRSSATISLVLPSLPQAAPCQHPHPPSSINPLQS